MEQITSICNFIPTVGKGEVRILTFVRETDAKVYGERCVPTCYRLHAVLAGEGTLVTDSERIPLSTGDVFLEFPARGYRIEGEGLVLAYIGFVGTHSIDLVGKLDLSPARCVFHEMEAVRGIFSEYVGISGTLVDLAAEAALLFALTEIGKRTLGTVGCEASDGGVALRVKRYLDEHFTECDLTLADVGRALSYHPKYLSRAFLLEYGFGINSYLRSLRVDFADSLIERGFTSVKDVAAHSGFGDALYFSKVYKAERGVSPTEAMRTEKKKKE